MNGEPLRSKVRIGNAQGLHMRPMKAFVDLASKFQSAVQVSKQGGGWVNGKSAWELLTLGAEKDSELTVQVSGPDEEAALKALVEFLENLPKFEESLDDTAPSATHP
jgi:phosphotransferase system HPr (HPr) family protein